MGAITVRGLALQSIQNTFSPPEGPKGIPLYLDFTTDSVQFLYVTDLYNKGAGYPGLSGLQTVYVDNSLGATDLRISVEGSGQSMTIKAGYQGFYPLLSPKQGRITFTSSEGPVNVLLLNVTIAAYQWSA